MRILQNLKMRSKILALTAIILLGTFTAVGISVFSMTKIQQTYSNIVNGISQRRDILLQIQSNVEALRFYCTDFLELVGADDADINAQRTKGDDAYNKIRSLANSYMQNKAHFEEKNIVTGTSLEERSKQLDDFLSTMEQYYNQSFVQMHLAIKDSNTETINKLLKDGRKIVDEALSQINNLVETNEKNITDALHEAGQDVDMTIYVTVGIALFLFIIAVFISIFVAHIISKSINQLVDVAYSVAEGNLNVDIATNRKDEIGILSSKINDVVMSVTNLVEDIKLLSIKHDEGDIEFFLDERKYKGTYGTVARGINLTTKSYVMMVHDVIGVLDAIGDGEFDYKMVAYKGKKAQINAAVNKFIKTLRSIHHEIELLAKSGAHGDISKRANYEAYKGEWASLVRGLNLLLETVSYPLEEVLAVITEMEKGRFDKKMVRSYEGDFNFLKTSLNDTINSIYGYISEIKDILGKIADGDLTKHIERDYAGQFSIIKDSINKIVSSLNSTMTEINSASEQVLTGSRQISQASMILAQGATEQSGSLSELTTTIDEISEQTHESAENAETAKQMSLTAKDTAESGNAEMKEMLVAMEGIKTSSNKISNIIKVIDEIATQTNLLALNAAVEAARAGEHGKGFTVVANSVRDLAVQSQSAAKETSELIKEAIGRINDGVQRASATAGALSQIVKNSAEVSSVISKITDASQRQEESVNHVNIGIIQISQVVQSNSASSEESAAASQELNSQAETLKSMVNYFKLQ